MREETVLEYLAKTEMTLTPKLICWHLVNQEGVKISQNTVSAHVRELEENGYLEKVEGGRGWYRISDKGRQYLRSDS